MADANQTQRLIAKVLRDVAGSRFESFTDLKDEFRRRLVQLRIVYSQQEFDAALTMVASNTVLAHGGPVLERAADVKPDPAPLSHTEASRLLAKVKAAPRTMNESAAVIPPGEDAPEHFPGLVEVRR